jgi:DNA polymerase III subunit gamma/tau
MAKAKRSKNPVPELHKKYRPKTIDDLRGNSVLKRTIKAHIENNSIPHAVLLSGDYGCGKTTIARILASHLKCSDFDLHEIDTADHTGIDMVRDIRKHMHHKPMKGKTRVWILDECHQMSKQAMNSLLKALEEPPSHAYFFLCTTDPNQLLKTIISRCTAFKVSTLGENALVQLMNDVCEKEKAEVPEEVLKQVAELSLGHPRDALKILSSIVVLGDAKAMTKMAQNKAKDMNKIIDLCFALENAPSNSWDKISGIIKGVDENPEDIRRAILGYFNQALLKNRKPRIAVMCIEEFADNFFYSGAAGVTLAAYKVFSRAAKG